MKLIKFLIIIMTYSMVNANISKCQVLYSENFSTNPLFTSKATDYAFWDSNNGNYYINTYDNLNNQYWAYSPKFATVKADLDFVFEIFINFENPVFGTYPGVNMYNAEPVSISAEEYSFNISMAYSTQHNQQLRFVKYGVFDYYTDTITKNNWYHIKIIYHAESKTADIIVIDTTSYNTFYEIYDVDFIISDFSWIGIGFYDEPNYGHDWSPMRVDNIYIEQEANEDILGRQALIDFYNSTNGNNWSNNKFWLGKAGTECTWFGIICNDYNQIESIHLFSNNLNGTIPDSIKDLIHLKSLLLHNNNLTGSVPNELLEITTLESITLNNNQLDNNIISLLNQKIKDEQNNWDVNNDNSIGIEEAIYALQISSGLFAKKENIVYHENFSTDPMFSSFESDFVYWDSEKQTYYAKIFDVSSGEGNYYAFSPLFETITGSFIIEFDFKVITQNFGTYPSLHFIKKVDDEIHYIVPFSYMNTSSQGKGFNVYDTYLNEYNLSSNPLENHWYKITFKYSEVTKDIQCTIVDKENSNIFYEITLHNFPIGVGFNQIFVGAITSPPKYGDWSDMEVDNILISTIDN